MTERQPRRQIALLVPVATVLLVVGLAVAIGISGAAAQPTLDCVGSGGGAAFVTDSGLTVYENHSAGTTDRFYFPTSDTVRFEYTTDALNLSASGTAEARLENGTGDTTCLANVVAGSNPITVDPDGEPALVIASDLSAIDYRSPVYDPADGEADLAYEASTTATLTVHGTGLTEGTTVIAEDVDTGDELTQHDVAADGSVTIDLPGGTARVNLHTPEPTATATPTESEDVVEAPSGVSGSDDGETAPADDEPDDSQDESDEADGTGGEAEVQVTSSQEGDETQTSATVQNAQGGEAVTVDVPSEGDPGPVETTSVSVTPAADADFSIDITTSPTPLDTSPTFDLADGTAPIGYVSVEHTLPNADIQQATFTHRVEIDAIEAAGSSPEDVSMYRYDGGSWSEQPTQLVGTDDGEAILQTTTDALSEWTVAAKRPRLNITDTAIDLQAATTDEAVTIQVFVSNTGGTDGVYEAELVLNQEVVQQRERTVPDGGTVALTFERTFDQPGIYEVRVNDVTVGEVNISAADESVAVDTEAGEGQVAADGDGSQQGDGAGDGGLPVLPLGVALVLVAGVALWGYLTRVR